jgi:hypothetical protein
MTNLERGPGAFELLGILRLRGWFASRTSHFAQDDNGMGEVETGSLRSLDSRRRLSPHDLFSRRCYCNATFMSRLWARKDQVSAVSSISFVMDLPAPWPAFVSMRIKIGAGPA